MNGENGFDDDDGDVVQIVPCEARAPSPAPTIVDILESEESEVEHDKNEHVFKSSDPDLQKLLDAAMEVEDATPLPPPQRRPKTESENKDIVAGMDDEFLNGLLNEDTDEEVPVIGPKNTDNIKPSMYAKMNRELKQENKKAHRPRKPKKTKAATGVAGAGKSKGKRNPSPFEVYVKREHSKVWHKEKYSICVLGLSLEKAREGASMKACETTKKLRALYKNGTTFDPKKIGL